MKVNQIKMSARPFIIKTKMIEPTVPMDSEVFDEVQQTRIQILQAINGYLTINMIIESLKIFWSFWHYEQECPAFSYLSLGFMGINLIWALCSYFGFKSIRSKNSRNIRIFGYTVFANFLLRIAMYIVSGVVMKGYVPTYAIVTPSELNNLICTALYPQTLYIITGIIEALISALILFLLKSIIFYVQKWEDSETYKHIPKPQYGDDKEY